MTSEQAHAFHEEIRNTANSLKEKADRYDQEGDENTADQLRAEARGMILALSAFWRHNQ